VNLLGYQFAQNALLAGLIISIVAGLVGRYVVLRNMSFAVHGIAEVGFTGTAAGVFFGIDPVLGLLAGAVLAAVGIGTLGVRLRDRDVAIGSVLAFGLGLGVLFLTLYTRYATEAFSVLFGSIISVSRQDVVLLLVLGIAVIVALGAIRRPLTFASIDPEVAEARGVPVRTISILFLLLLAVAVAEAIQVVGVLMVLALLITPAAAAQKLTVRPGMAMALGVAIALVCTLGGVVASLITLYPASFFVATTSFAIYVLSRVVGPSLTSRRSDGATAG
jgi:zinc/manganese transport system permease protein